MRFDINLASQPYQDVHRFLLRWGLALLGVTLVTGGLVYAASNAFLSWRITKKQVRYVQQQIEARNQQKAAAEAFLGRSENRDTRDRSLFLNSLLARKAFSWTEVFSDLEQIVPPDLQIVSISPDFTPEGQLLLKLSAVGASRNAAIGLVRKLEDSPHFTQAQLNSEDVQISAQNKAESERFAISAIYLPSFTRPQKAAIKAQEATGAAKGGR